MINKISIGKLAITTAKEPKLYKNDNVVKPTVSKLLFSGSDWFISV